MHIICPHCENAIELIELKAREEVSCPSCGSSFHVENESTTDWCPRDGQKFGRFELLRLVGQGAFGTVYQARDRELDRLVAVKVPRAGNLGGGDLDRFLREARSVAQLRHPSIVPVYEVGQHDGVPFLVSEFVQGVTLADLISGERLTPQRAAQMVAVVADAIQYAHEHGVIHRDIKPSNILLDGDGAPHVMDFGLAKRDAGEITMTLDGQVLGTPAYMSPEQARGEAHQVDGRSDVYSLGVILYRLLTGVLPFKGNTRMLLHHVLHDEPKAPRKVDAAVPRDLETICLKAMAKEPRGRYASAGALADDLRRFLKGEPIQARRVGAVERAGKWVRRRPAAAALLALAVLGAAAAVGGGVWWWQRDAAAAEARQVKVEYYANIVKRWGVPEGIGPLTEEQAKHRQTTYRFCRRDGKVERMEAVNGHGVPVFASGWRVSADLDVFGGGEKHSRACRYEYHRNDAGQLVEEVALDNQDRPVWVFHYTTPTLAQFTDPHGFPLARTASGAAYVEFTWSDKGFVKEMRFRGLNKQPRPDNHRIYGYHYELDERGLPLETRFLGPQGEPVVHRDGGYAKIADAYNERGDRVQEAYFDPKDRAVLSKTEGAARQVMAFDARGNLLEIAFLGVDGRPTPGATGTYKWVTVWDDQGDLVEWGGRDADGKPMMAKADFATGRGRCDARGNLCEFRHYGPDDKPILTRLGYWRHTMTFDDRNNRIEYACFGLDDKPVASLYGFARVTTAYDARSNPTEISFWGPGGKPTLQTMLGVAREAMSYDDRDNVVERTYFGLDGEPILAKTTGVARETIEYDERGNRIATASFGVDGRPAPDRQGVAQTLRKYDEFGDVIEVNYLGTDGKPVLAKLGYCRATFTFDKHGNHTDSAYFDLDGKPLRTRVVVTDYVPDFEPEEFDLKSGDVLESYDGKPVTCAIKFVNDKRAEGVGDKPKELRLLRDGKPVVLVVPPGWSRDRYGWELETVAVAGDK